MSSSSAILELREVSVRFQARKGSSFSALDGVSLDVEANTFASVVGPSGCGKSTMLRIVAGLQTQTSGSVSMNGSSIDGPSADRGMVFQSYTLFPWLTVRDNAAFGPRLKGMSRRESSALVDELLAAVGLSEFADAYASELSGGMRQRAALARALANDPSVLLMDEPFGALDSQTRVLMQELLLDVWQRRRKTVLFITHDIDEALLLGDVVHVMTARPGRIKASLAIDIPRPRGAETPATPRFLDYKKEIVALMRDEAKRAAMSEGKTKLSPDR